MNEENPNRIKPPQPAHAREELSVAIVGATGAVGEVLIDILERRGFPVGELRPLASARSVGTSIEFKGERIPVREATPENFDGADLVFFAATGALSKNLAPEAVERGAIVIDKSGTWRMHEDVPLVVPEINAPALDNHKGIIANPNCTTTGVVMALEPIRRAAGLESVVITTLQAVSGAGREGMDELDAQNAARAAGDEPVVEIFAAQIAGNVVPLCDVFTENGYSTEEMKLIDESRKILGLPGLDITTTCVRVPVAVGHSASLLVGTQRPIDPDQARQAVEAFPGVEIVDDTERGRVPTPLDIAGHDEILVGRIRKDIGSDRLWMWQVGNNLRKGAATNAVQIAEALIERRLIGSA